jgi:hypothetical protein
MLTKDAILPRLAIFRPASWQTLIDECWRISPFSKAQLEPDRPCGSRPEHAGNERRGMPEAAKEN